MVNSNSERVDLRSVKRIKNFQNHFLALENSKTFNSVYLPLSMHDHNLALTRKSFLLPLRFFQFNLNHMLNIHFHLKK